MPPTAWGPRSRPRLPRPLHQVLQLVPRQATFAPLPSKILALLQRVCSTATGQTFLEAALGPPDGGAGKWGPERSGVR